MKLPYTHLSLDERRELFRLRTAGGLITGADCRTDADRA